MINYAQNAGPGMLLLLTVTEEMFVSKVASLVKWNTFWADKEKSQLKYMYYTMYTFV
jgi:hypothetical protein